MTLLEAQQYAERILLCLRNQETWEDRVSAVSGEILRIRWDVNEHAPKSDLEA